MEYRVNYNNTGETSPLFQILQDKDPSKPEDFVNRNPSFRNPSDVEVISLVGPISELEQDVSLLSLGTVAVFEKDGPIYVRDFYAEGIDGHTAKLGILKYIEEDPTQFEHVELYQGLRLIKRFSKGGTQQRPREEYFFPDQKLLEEL